mmetsp:Transcript_23707/g.28603  ORF Transcript_23707/g.28603 Transcript_23707/m.28603 type:complete len:88 (+) Transcript_23707:30-293(+)
MATTEAPAAPQVAAGGPSGPVANIVENNWSIGLYACINDLIKGGSDDSDVVCASSAVCPCIMEGKIAAVVAYSFAYPPSKANVLEGT